MDRAGAAHLISGGLIGDEVDEVEDLCHGDTSPDFSEANTRHVGRSQDPVGGRYGLRGNAVDGGVASSEQRRGTRNKAARPERMSGGITAAHTLLHEYI